MISPSGDDPAGSDGGPSATIGSNTSDIRSELNTILKESSGDINKTLEAIKGLASKIGVSAQRLIRTAVTNDFLENYQAPLAILTGAPVGEWHLTIGNPCNPIAMIGNLVCNSVNIEFSDTLGPDDFPTGIKATFNLEHGRDRERGEIESIFNRGDGRLYQSTKNTYANSQSYNAIGDINGNTLSEEYKEQFLNNDGNIFNYVPIDDVIGQGGE
jgi:hypothetical protein